MAAELNPCPFCGGRAEFTKTINGRYIKCTDCHSHIFVPEGMEEEAAKKWNTRTLTAVLSGIRGCPICGGWSIQLTFHTNDMKCLTCGLHMSGKILAPDYTESVARWNGSVNHR